MTNEILKFNIPLSNLEITLESDRRPVQRVGDGLVAGPKKYTGSFIIREKDRTYPSNKLLILDNEAMQRFMEEIASLYPQKGRVVSGEVFERATKRRIEIILREVEL